MSTAATMSSYEVSTSGYKLDKRLFIPARAAHYLDWAAQHFPKVFIPYNVLVKAIMGYSKAPRSTGEEVDRIRSMSTRIRNILLDEYGRSTVTDPGKAIRATFDDEDLLKECVTRQGARLLSARNSFVRVAEKVSVKNVPSCPEKRWFQGDAKALRDMLGSEDFERRLLPARMFLAEQK